MKKLVVIVISVSLCSLFINAQVVPNSGVPVSGDVSAGQLILPEITTRFLATTAGSVAPRGWASYFQQIRGNNACIEVDGGQLYINPQGNIRFHGAERPRWLVRVSRRTDGASINGSDIQRVWFTGEANIQLVNDGAEGFRAANCHWENYATNGTCIALTNIDRPVVNDYTNRQPFTTSWHTFDACGMSVWGQVTITGSGRPACIRMVGCVTDAKIRDCWISGNAAFLVLVDMPDESGTDWARWNVPLGIIVEDCVSESKASRAIRLYNYADVTVDKGVYKLASNGQMVLTLRGKSLDNFDVYIGDSDIPLK